MSQVLMYKYVHETRDVRRVGGERQREEEEVRGKSREGGGCKSRGEAKEAGRKRKEE